MRRLSWFGIAVVVAHAVMACNGSLEEAAVGESGESELNENVDTATHVEVFTKADDGRTVTVGEGKDVAVELPVKSAWHAFGYRWHVVTTDRSFGQPTPYEAVPNGADFTQRFVWKTRGAVSLIGEHTVTMELRRPRPRTSGVPLEDEPMESPPGDTFSFTVKIVRSACAELVPPGPNFCSGGTIGTRQDTFGCDVYTCGYGTDGDD